MCHTEGITRPLDSVEEEWEGGRVTQAKAGLAFKEVKSRRANERREPQSRVCGPNQGHMGVVLSPSKLTSYLSFFCHACSLQPASLACIQCGPQSAWNSSYRSRLQLGKQR